MMRFGEAAFVAAFDNGCFIELRRELMPDKYHRLISFLIIFCCCFLFIPVSAQTNGPESPNGNLEMSVEGSILVNETELIGLEIIDDSIHSPHTKSAENVHEANIEVSGDLTGSLKGFVFDIPEDSEIVAKVLVTGSISGEDRSVEISEYTTDKNLDLTVWRIEKNNGHASETPDGGVSEFEGFIKYLIKIDPDSKSKIRVVDGNGNELPVIKGPVSGDPYHYMKEGDRLYLEPIGTYELQEAYNGKDIQVPLRRDGQNRLYLDIPKGGAVWLSAEKHSEPHPSIGTSLHQIDYDRIAELEWLMDVPLPATGFSASHKTALPARPQGLTYGTTGFTLQLPTLDVMEPIITVPLEGESYPVEWLESSIGMLEQSSLPGLGITVLAAHNHLNTTKAGPFLFIKTMKTGDRIMVTDADNTMRIYRVYGSYKIAANGFASIAEDLRENMLVLITCEDESVSGGYLNRRVVFAEPCSDPVRSLD